MSTQAIVSVFSESQISEFEYSYNIPANCPAGVHPGKKISQRGSPGKKITSEKSAKLSFALYPDEIKPIPVKNFRYAPPLKF